MVIRGISMATYLIIGIIVCLLENYRILKDEIGREEVFDIFLLKILTSILFILFWPVIVIVNLILRYF